MVSFCNKYTSFCSRHFWKFVAGFLIIVGLSIGALFGFEYWQNYREEEAMKTLMKEIERQQAEEIPEKDLEKPFELR